jgi:signal transduction histidine kinase
VGRVARRDAKGKPLRMAGTRRDISERRKLDEALARARDKALETSRAKSAFLANMTHELRTPLDTILGFSEMLEEEALAIGSKESQSDVARLQAAARHLLGLINDILDLSKIEAGRMILRPEPFAVADVVRDVVSTVGALMEKNANRFEARLGPALGAMRADPTRLRQCLLNLLGNAAKFTLEGSVSLEVERSVIDGEERVRFEVSDTGVGVAPDQMDRLFQDFSQASPTTERRFGGTGLGLSITRKLCRLMGGDVTARSELGRGSVFTITLPPLMPGGA